LKQIKDWLYNSDIDFDDNLLKPDLVELAHEDWDPMSELQELAEEFGHEITYLPPYHPEFNAIELAWARAKDYAGICPSHVLEQLF